MAITFQPVTDIALANEYLAAKLLWFKGRNIDEEWRPDKSYDWPIDQDALDAGYYFALRLEE